MTPNARLRLGCYGFRWDRVQDQQGVDGDCGEGVPASIGIATFDQACRRCLILRIGCDHGAYGIDLETSGQSIRCSTTSTREGMAQSTR